MANYLKERENSSDCGNLKTWRVRLWSLKELRFEVADEQEKEKKHGWEFLEWQKAKELLKKEMVTEQQNLVCFFQGRKESANAVTICELAGVCFRKKDR